jgi:catechol 2,3-dioxygenase-like lactoylglutathione lyase family enzyme
MASQRVHIALAMPDLAAAIHDYAKRLGVMPSVVAVGEYALFRTPILNLSLTFAPASKTSVRHLGFEDASCLQKSADADPGGMMWERFSVQHQADEIKKLWPNTSWKPKE